MLPDIDRVADLLREAAAQEILPRFVGLSREDVAEKSPGDLVTAADLAAEQHLTRRLPDLLPGSVAIGEEAVSAGDNGLEMLAGDTPVWVIDPLDGTGNFACGLPIFCVMVALVRAGEVLAGWILDPVSGRSATASAGDGAWMTSPFDPPETGARRLRVSMPAEPRQMTGAIYGRKFRTSEAYRRIWGAGRGALGLVFNTRCVGQEYLSRIQGRMHFGVYTRLNPWDHAAGTLLHQEAGGHVARFDGTPYRPTRYTPGILVTPDRALWDEMHAALIAPVDG